MKNFIIFFYISLLIISCSNKGKDLRIALNNHKNEYGIEDIRTLIKEKRYNEALYQSASLGYSDIVSGLVKAGADINAKSLDGSTPLIALCREGNIKSAGILIENGADMNMTDNSGKKALDYLKNKKDILGIVTGYDLIEMFNGDCSIITINDSDSIKFISALSLKNQNQFINLIEKNQNNIRKIGNNEYWIEDGEFNLYISNSTAYICDLSLNKLKNILNSQSNSNNNSRFAINNDISFFIDVNKAYNLIKENNELDILMNELHYISGAINIKNNYGFKGYIRLNFKNENSLASFIKILSKIEY